MIVDDDQINSTALRKYLETKGYLVAEATSAEEALQQILKCTPDAILLDVMMPHIDGYELCRRLKKFSRTAPIPILMVSALSAKDERLKGIEAGANDFLTKPVDLKDLSMRVANAVYTKRLFDQLQAEQQKSESLLLNVLPKPIAMRIKNGETDIADQHPDVSILIADVLGLQELVAHIAPEQVVYFLNELFSAFDNIVETRGLEKIKTMGATYMAAAGVPYACDDHARKTALAALDMRKEVDAFNAQYNTFVSLRVGLSTGPVIAGVIGRKKFAYDLWGTAVNEAWHVLSGTHEAGIRATHSTFELLKDTCRFETNGSSPVFCLSAA